jgi:SNF2 family DNA or RNA helicase
MLLQRKTRDFLVGLANNYKTMLVIDESSRMKNPTSQTTKTILSLVGFFPCRVLLSGTPAPNSETEYWSQMRFLHPTIFESSFYTFRSMFFHLRRGNQTMPCWGYTNPDLLKKGWKYAITESSRKMLVSRMQPYVIFKELKDCVDLPEQTHIMRRFDLCDEQQQSYDEMRDDMVAEIQEQMIAANMALTKITKLRQITSGFMHDTGEGKSYDYRTNSKLGELLELLEEIGDNQVIIWTWFQHEADIIARHIGAGCAIVNGTVNEQQKQDNIEGFKNGRIKYLIANPLSIAHGLTLTNCHYAIYYSLSYSWEQLSQSLARIHRMSQKNPCIYYYLIANNTIDEVVYETLQNKGDAEDIVKGLINQR